VSQYHQTICLGGPCVLAGAAVAGVAVAAVEGEEKNFTLVFSAPKVFFDE